MTMSRNYWSPIIREALHNGKITIDQDDLLREYRKWRDQDVILNFENPNGECIEAISPKRGNRQYAKRKRRRYQELQSGMDGLKWDFAIPKTRSNVIRKTHLLFITLTFNRSYSIQESWQLCTSKGGELNRFSARLHKILGNKATFKAKEAQASGYAAPHILCIIDRPLTAFKHKGKWRLQNREILEQIKKAWPHGYVDIMACVDGRIEGKGVLSYMMKYSTKVVSLDPMNPNKTHIAELTHAWNKIFGTRDVISKQFLERLNLHKQDKTEDKEPSGWELISIEISLNMNMILQHDRCGMVRSREELFFAG
jgi:hypothetical protein